MPANICGDFSIRALLTALLEYLVVLPVYYTVLNLHMIMIRSISNNHTILIITMFSGFKGGGIHHYTWLVLFQKNKMIYAILLCLLPPTQSQLFRLVLLLGDVNADLLKPSSSQPKLLLSVMKYNLLTLFVLQLELL